MINLFTTFSTLMPKPKGARGKKAPYELEDAYDKIEVTCLVIGNR